MAGGGQTKVTIGSVTWICAEAASKDIAELRDLFGPMYNASVHALREFLVSYFNTDVGCTSKQGSSISPMGATPTGGKILKVRWAYPGAGKSGGLRLCLVAFCTERKVVVCHVSIRRDVENDAFLAAARAADDYR